MCRNSHSLWTRVTSRRVRASVALRRKIFPLANSSLLQMKRGCERCYRVFKYLSHHQEKLRATLFRRQHRRASLTSSSVAEPLRMQDPRRRNRNRNRRCSRTCSHSHSRVTGALVDLRRLLNMPWTMPRRGSKCSPPLQLSGNEVAPLTTPTRKTRPAKRRIR